MGRTIQEENSPTTQISNSTSVSLLNFARLFPQKQIILFIFLFGISRQKHLSQQRFQLQHPLKKSYDENFTNDAFLIHPTIIPFLTAMEVNGTRLNIMPSVLKEDIVDTLLRETADPVPFGPGHWQGNNNMGDNVTEVYIKLQPFIAPINHNTLTSAKAIQVVHTLMGNFCHGDKDKISQMEDKGNVPCLLMGYHNKVRCAGFCQINLVMRKNSHTSFHF